MFQIKTSVFFLVVLWWIANGLTSLYSKTEMNGAESIDKKLFVQMKSLDLTILQFLVGVAGSTLWIYIIERGSLNIKKFLDWNDFVMIFGNLLGHLSVNISYTFVSSSATQVVKSSEPIFMFIFLHCLKSSQNVKKQNMNILILFSTILMAFGTCIFVLWDSTFNIFGIIAAVASNIAFPLRNIALKNVGKRYESPFQNYFVLSFFGTLMLLPLKMLSFTFKNFPLFNLSKTGVAASTFHCVYNLASISVLQNVSPLNHAILNFSKRIFVITANIIYFNLSMTWHMVFGLFVVFFGLAIYLFTQKAKSTSNMFSITCLLKISTRQLYKACFIACTLIMLPTFVYVFSYREKYSIKRNVNDEWLINANRGEVLTTAWIFNKPTSHEFIKNIVTINKQTRAFINVYCGTTKCLNAVEKLQNPMITGSLLVVPKVLGKTPLKEWGECHVMYKFLTGLHYERYLTKALCLAHLWQYGGAFYLPSNKVIKRLSDSTSWKPQDWPCMLLKDYHQAKILFKKKALLSRHEEVEKSIEIFLQKMSSWNTRELPPLFQDTVWNAFSGPCPNEKRWCMIRNSKSLRDLYARQGIPFEDENHFGTLSFDGNNGLRDHGNIGDEIQSIAGMQFLPFIDFFLDRDTIIAPNTRGNHTVFFNAWWGYKRLRWPPPQNIDPVMVAVHTEKRFREVISPSKEAIDFLKSRAPIGTRDVVTRRFLESLGVQSFFSGCMTLFLRIRNPPPLDKRMNNTIYITDLSNKYVKLLPRKIINTAKFVKHETSNDRNLELWTQERFVDAYKILEKYSTAKLVITQRIHAALPCVAMGTPVLFFNVKGVPGGGVKVSERVTGLLELFHSIDPYKLNISKIRQKIKEFDWANPPKNPNLGSRMRLVSSMWYVLRKNQAIYESARRFGMLPLTPQWLTNADDPRIFHVILTNTNQDDTKAGELDWHQWRCVESILRYHPTSKLFVHSNTIDQSIFNVFTEVGYQVTVMKYDVPDFVEHAPLKEFLLRFEQTSLDKMEMEKILLKHGVLKLLLLYKYGGTCLDENTIVLKVIDNPENNELSLDSESEVNGWILHGFEKNHKFLRDVLETFPTVYNLEMKADGGKALLTKVCFIVNSAILAHSSETDYY